MGLPYTSLLQAPLRSSALSAQNEVQSFHLEHGPNEICLLSRFLEKAAHGTVAGREGWKNGLPPGEGVFVSTRPGSGAGVLVSPTRERQDGKNASTQAATTTTTKPVEIPNAGGGKTRGGGDSAGFMPRFSPVNDTFVKKPLW